MLPTRARVAAAVVLTVLTVLAVRHQPHARRVRTVGPVEAGLIRTLAVRADRGQARDEVPVTPTAPVTTTSTVPVGVRYTPPRRPAAPIRGAVPSADAWARLRQCESGGNYANKRNPTYRGAYQFDRSSWASVGGQGDPADASPAEQDARARLLYAQRGAQPWPQCGRFLR